MSFRRGRPSPFQTLLAQADVQIRHDPLVPYRLDDLEIFQRDAQLHEELQQVDRVGRRRNGAQRRNGRFHL